MSSQIIQRDASGDDKEVILEIDGTSQSGSGNTLSVKGCIVDRKNKGIANLTVRAFDEGVNPATALDTFGGNTTLGETVTAASGEYIIYFSSLLLPEGKELPDLFIKVYEGDDFLVESPVVASDEQHETLDLAVLADDEEFLGDSEFEDFEELINPYIDGLVIDDLELSAIDTMSIKLEIEPEFIGDFLKAKQLADEVLLSYPSDDTLSDNEKFSKRHQVIYGLLRFDIAYEIDEFLKTTENNISTGVDAMCESNIIDPDIIDDIDDILSAYNDSVHERELLDTDSDGNVITSQFSELLAIAGISSAKQIALSKAFDQDDVGDDFWDTVSGNIITAQESTDIRYVFQLNIIAQKHLPMVSDLFSSYSSIEELSKGLSESILKTKIDSLGVPGIDSPTDDEEELYSELILRELENSYPSNVLSNEIDDDDTFSEEEFKTFIQNPPANTPNFDVKRFSFRRFLKRNPNSLDNNTDLSKANIQIKRARRLYNVVGNRKGKPGIITRLVSNKIGAANRVTRFSKRKFKRKFSTVLSPTNQILGEAMAEEIYNSSVKRTAASIMTYAKYGPELESINTRVFPKSPLSTEQIDNSPELDAFFKESGYCDCTHCRSSQSPAAYLIDLISFIKEAEQEDSIDAWDELQARRPEMIKLETSCENTNTAMPYIDLVNEVLEYAISPNVEENLRRQTTLDEKSLRAEPEHLNKDAYDILSGSNYPWLLPFNLWNTEANTFLSKLNVPRANIVSAVDKQISNLWSPMTLDEVMVYLNMSEELLTILNDNSAFSKYYDGKSALSLMSVPTLLDTTFLTYDELVELLATNFISADGDVVIDFSPDTSCELEDALILSGSVGSEKFLRNLHRFVRLQKLLKWSPEELDIVISAMGKTAIDEDLIILLGGLKKIVERLGLNPKECASWFGTLSTHVYDDDNVSQYDSVFLNPVYNTDPEIRKSYGFEDGAEPVVLLTDGVLDITYSPLVIGSLRIKSQDLIKLINAELHEGALTQQELSHIHRVVSFTKKLRITIDEYLILKNTFKKNPITTTSVSIAPNDTLEFLTWFEVLTQSKFKIKDLNYLLRHDFVDGYINSTDTKIIEGLTKLRQKIQAKLGQKNIKVSKDQEDLLNLFLLYFNEAMAVKAMRYVVDTALDDDTITEATNFIEVHWTPIIGNTSDIITQLITDGGAITTFEERIEYTFMAFHDALTDLLQLKEEVILYFSEWLVVSQDVVEILLEELMKSPDDSNKSLAHFLTDSSFLYGVDDIQKGTTYDSYFDSAVRLQKVGLVISTLKITAENIGFVSGQTAETGWYNILEFPTSLTELADATSLEQLMRLTQVFQLEKKYYKADEFSVIGLIEQAVLSGEDVDTSALTSVLSKGTGWDLVDIQFLIGSEPNAFDFQPIDFKNERWLLLLHNAFLLQSKVPVSLNQLMSWGSRNVTYETARKIIASTKSAFELSDWYEVGAEVRDTLRSMQRDALSSYLIAQVDGFSSTNDLYSHFLLDTEMEPCMMISRVKLCTLSIQLWVQRISMNLEPNIQFKEDDLDEWSWRKNYRVWEAARKVFLYPENWIEPELRDNKSQFFLELEEELLQGEVTTETVEKAYLNYLLKLDQVAYLEVMASYQEQDQDILHVFARTKDSPHVYFYRKLIDKESWTPWEKLDLDIEGDHLIPVVFNRRLMLFWPMFNELFEDPDLNNDDDADEPADEYREIDLTDEEEEEDDFDTNRPDSVLEIRMAYTQFTGGKWQSKKLSKSSIEYSADDPEEIFFKVNINDGGLLCIDAFFHERDEVDFDHMGGFTLNNCSGELASTTEKNMGNPSPYAVSNTDRSYQQLYEHTDNTKFEITESFDLGPRYKHVTERVPINQQVILANTPSRFKLTYGADEQEVLSNSPFFYEDDYRVFFVVPSAQTFSKPVMAKVSPRYIKVKKSRKISIPLVGSAITSQRQIESVIRSKASTLPFGPKSGNVSVKFKSANRNQVLRLNQKSN